MDDDAELHALRGEIDSVNRALRDVLQRRARLVEKIARRKRHLGVPLVDEARERAMLAALLADPGEGFTRDELAAVLDDLLRAYRQLCLRAGTTP
jgi:chorismate mutase